MTTTQNCAECGTRAEPGQSFCDACGAVLSWAGASGVSAGPAGASGAATGGTATGAGATAPVAAGAAGVPGRGAYARTDEGARPATRAAHDGPGAAAAAGSAAVPGSGSAARSQRAPGVGPVPGAASGTAPTGSGRRDPAADTADAGAAGRADETGGAGRTGGAGYAPDADLRDRPNTAPDAAPLGGPRSVEDTAPTEPIPHAGPMPGSGPVPHAGSMPGPGPVPDADPAPDAEPVGPYPPLPAQGGDDLNDRARQLLVPVQDPEPRPAATPSVVPVLPGRPTPQRPQSVRAPGEELGTGGGVACPWCATPNRPDRHYCTRCAMPMAGGSEPPPPRPWWRRLLDGRRGETPWAGDRPRLRRTFGRILSWAGYAIVLAALIVAAVNLPKGIQATKDHFAKRSEVTPDAISASRTFPGHKPLLVIDKKSNTWWGPGVAGPGEGQWIEAKFDQPTRLLDLLITPGVSAHADKNTTSALPHRVKATITRDDGTVVDREITLDQGSGAQPVQFRVGEVTKVRFTIESSFLTSSKKQVAIAEIEFFGPSGNTS
ncbi:zinc ribbon domain-containing protein [Streptomyces sp. NPDC047028]|uniref:NADase-type glycan-binding domain-containing protein n=1 Tax=Streptomyces sp. NPDC047028 TaxID=3155793 RepID=UPI0033F298A9